MRHSLASTVAVPRAPSLQGGTRGSPRGCRAWPGAQRHRASGGTAAPGGSAQGDPGGAGTPGGTPAASRRSGRSLAGRRWRHAGSDGTALRAASGHPARHDPGQLHRSGVAIRKTGEGFQQCYNGQAAVDEASRLIVAVDLSNQAPDNGRLLPVLAREDRRHQIPRSAETALERIIALRGSRARSSTASKGPGPGRALAPSRVRRGCRTSSARPRIQRCSPPGIA